MTPSLATWTFGPKDQRTFGALTGDVNPIHLDAARARRELFGRRILHGLHGALRAYDAVLGRLGCQVRLTRVQGRFLAPVFLGERVALAVVEETATSAALELRTRDHLLYELGLEWETSKVEHSTPRGVRPAARLELPAEFTLEELRNRAGSMTLDYDEEAFVRFFPHVARALTRDATGAICAVTRLVGMEAPGMQSLLSSFNLRLVAAPDGPSALEWRVTSVEPRFSLVKSEVVGGGIVGPVEAFFRPAPAAQRPFTDVLPIVGPGRYRGIRALVIGGSRGLGEATAKLLAAGGADIVLTYRHLAMEAHRVANEIRSGGGACHVLQWDVLDPVPGTDALVQMKFVPTHLFYFATPRIIGRKTSGFSPRAFRLFCHVYVNGLDATMRACREITREALTLFIPSTAQLDVPVKGQAEYASAKAAAEQYCRQLAVADRKLRLVVERLPRAATDQSLSLLHQPAQDPTDLMHRALERLEEKPA